MRRRLRLAPGEREQWAEYANAEKLLLKGSHRLYYGNLYDRDMRRIESWKEEICFACLAEHLGHQGYVSWFPPARRMRYPNLVVEGLMRWGYESYLRPITPQLPSWEDYHQTREWILPLNLEDEGNLSVHEVIWRWRVPRIIAEHPRHMTSLINCALHNPTWPAPLVVAASFCWNWLSDGCIDDHPLHDDQVEVHYLFDDGKYQFMEYLAGLAGVMKRGGIVFDDRALQRRYVDRLRGTDKYLEAELAFVPDRWDSWKLQYIRTLARNGGLLHLYKTIAKRYLGGHRIHVQDKPRLTPVDVMGARYGNLILLPPPKPKQEPRYW